MKFLIILIFMMMSFMSCDDYLKINYVYKKINKLASSYSLEPFGTGVSAPVKIKDFRMSYRTHNHYNELSARKLIVDFTEDYIKLINSCQEVKNNFEKLPVTEDHAFFFIIFEDSNNDYYKDLSAVMLGNGKIYFLKVDANNSLQKSEGEPYSKAYFKVYGTEPPERY